MSYHVWRFTPFSPNDGSYGHFYGIFCLNDLIFCHSVHPGVENNVAEESFIFFAWKSHFLFLECKKWGFCEGHTKYLLQNWIKTFKNIWYHILCTHNQMVGVERFSSTSREKDKFLPIQMKAGQIWTTSASWFAHDFSKKIIFWYKSAYFMRDIPKFLDDSTPR